MNTATVENHTNPTAEMGSRELVRRAGNVAVEKLLLANGHSVVIRPIVPQDAKGEQEFVTTMSPTSRLRRFHRGLAALPDDLLRAFTQVDFRSHVALVAEADDGHSLVADARYVVDGREPTAEFAIAVSDSWQGSGLGRHLMQRLMRHAADPGLDRLHGDILPSNQPMLALMRSLGAEISVSPDDDSLCRAELIL
jgi:acetyltransferase